MLFTIHMVLHSLSWDIHIQMITVQFGTYYVMEIIEETWKEMFLSLTTGFKSREFFESLESE